jgi:hypothetical protein
LRHDGHRVAVRPRPLLRPRQRPAQVLRICDEALDGRSRLPAPHWQT